MTPSLSIVEGNFQKGGEKVQLFHVGSKLASSENSVSDLALKVARRKGNKEKETGGMREKKGGRETVAGNNTKTCEETVAEKMEGKVKARGFVQAAQCAQLVHHILS